jgi:hypothetical protein
MFSKNSIVSEGSTFVGSWMMIHDHHAGDTIGNKREEALRNPDTSLRHIFKTHGAFHKSARTKPYIGREKSE